MATRRQLEKLDLQTLLNIAEQYPDYFEAVNEFRETLIEMILQNKNLDLDLEKAIRENRIDDAVNYLKNGAKLYNSRIRDDLLNKIVADSNFRIITELVSNDIFSSQEIVKRFNPSDKFVFLVRYLHSSTSMPIDFLRHLSPYFTSIRENNMYDSLIPLIRNKNYVWPNRLDPSYKHLDREIVKILIPLIPSRLRYQAAIIWPEYFRNASLREQATRAAMRHHLTDEEVAELTDIPDLLP